MNIFLYIGFVFFSHIIITFIHNSMLNVLVRLDQRSQQCNIHVVTRLMVLDTQQFTPKKKYTMNETEGREGETC